MLNIHKRNLPHWELADSVYYITFNLFEGKFNKEEILIVKKHIIDGNNKFYTLYAVVVMSTHVNLIIQPKKEFTLSRIMKGIKGVFANILNKNRGTTGKIWQDESFDRILRDENEYNEKLTYMYDNPIKAGITEDPCSYEGWYFNDKLE